MSSTRSGRCSPRRSTRVEPCSPSSWRWSSSTGPWEVAGEPRRAPPRLGRGRESAQKPNAIELFARARRRADARRMGPRREPVGEAGRLFGLTAPREGGTVLIDRSFKTNGQQKQATTTFEINAARAGGGSHPRQLADGRDPS